MGIVTAPISSTVEARAVCHYDGVIRIAIWQWGTEFHLCNRIHFCSLLIIAE